MPETVSKNNEMTLCLLSTCHIPQLIMKSLKDTNYIEMETRGKDLQQEKSINNLHKCSLLKMEKVYACYFMQISSPNHNQRPWPIKVLIKAQADSCKMKRQKAAPEETGN